MKLLQSRKIVYTGDIKLLFNHDVDEKVYEHVFNTHDIMKGGLSELKTKLSNLDYLQLIAASGFQTMPNTLFLKYSNDKPYVADGSYYSVDGLMVTHAFRDNLLYLFSFGEIESGKYAFYSEGVWELYASKTDSETQQSPPSESKQTYSRNTKPD